MTTPRYLAVGDCALSVEFGDGVDPATNARVLALDAVLGGDLPEGVIELVPTYRALMIHFDPLVTSLAVLRDKVERMLATTISDAGPGRLWRVPVGYGGELGIDLADLAKRHGMTEDEVVSIHSSATYRVYMIGFAPGFSYLGGLPEELHTPRRTEPRLVTPAGTVSIGGAQSAVTSVAVPSGWHLIGQTPLRTFDPKRIPVFLFDPGDRVCFEPISHADFMTLSDRIARGEFRPEPEEVS